MTEVVQKTPYEKFCSERGVIIKASDIQKENRNNIAAILMLSGRFRR